MVAGEKKNPPTAPGGNVQRSSTVTTIPAWLAHTLSAFAGAGVVIVTITLAFSDVKHKAHANDERSTDNESRIRIMERWISAQEERDKAFKAQLDRIEAQTAK